MAGMTYEQLMAQQDSGEESPNTSERGLTFEELQAQSSSVPSDLKKGWGNAAMLADMALNLPSDAFGLLANTGARIGGLLAGEDRRSSAQAAQRIQGEAQELAGKVGLIRDPAKKLLSALGYGDAYDKGYVGQAMGAISEGISKVGAATERGTNGAVLKEDVEHMAETLMTFGGPGAVYHGGKAMLQKAGERAKAAPAPVTEPGAPDLPPEHPGDINFDRPLTPEEAGTRTKAGKVKRPGQPYSSLREVTPEQKESVSRALEFEARNIQKQLDAMQPDEAGQLPPEALALQTRLRSIEEDFSNLNREPSSPLARETVYGNEFGEFPEGKNPDLAEPNVQPGIDVAPFVAERRAQPLEERIRAGRQAQVDAGFRTKEGDIEQAWQQHKSEQARAAELDARRKSLADIEENLTRRPLVNQKGAIDQDLLMKMGLGAAAATAGLYAYSRPDQQEEIATAAAAVGGVLATRGKISKAVLAAMPERALGPLLADGKYTLKTLDRLPQNQTEFHPAQIRQELNKPGTPAAEKTALEGTIARAEAEGRKVTAQELVSDFRMKTGDHTLTPKYVDDYSDYGSDNIRRGDTGNWIAEGDPTPETPKYKTIIWQFPEHMEVATTNHFGDPRYYGHTREFRENGVDHVMEIQSDLAQGVRKPLTPEQRTAISKEIAAFEVRAKAPRPDLTREQNLRWQELRMSLLRDKTTQAVQGKSARLSKDNYDILISEKARELRNAADSERPRLLDELAELKAEQDFAPLNPVVGYAPLTPALKNAENRLIREKLGEAAAKGDESVRFASADTVAKVEGWSTVYKPDQKGFIDSLAGRFAERDSTGNVVTYTGEISNGDGGVPRAILSNGDFHTLPKLPPSDRAAAFALLEKFETQFDQPGHQSLYDRYAKETTAYLKKLGGKEVVDAEGHTWLEVPTGGKGAATEPRPFGGRTDASGQGPIEMYGRIEPDLAVKLGVTATGAAIGGYLAGDEKIAGMILGGIGGLAATRLPVLGRSIGKVISPQQAFGTAVRISAALGAGYYLGGKVDHPVEGAAIASALLLGRKFLKPVVKRESDVALNIRNGSIAAWETIIHNTKREIDSQVADPARRVAITEALQVGARNSLAPNERAVFDMVTEMNAITGRDAIDAKVLKSLRQNYITSILEFKPTASKTERQLLVDKIIGRMESRDSAGAGSRFARQRKYDTFSELNRAIEGTELQLKTKDVGEILELYTRSMRKAIEDRILIDFHKAAKATDGLSYVAKADSYGRFPAGFRKIDHPQLKNTAIHPEAYDGMRMVLENYQPGVIMAGLFGLSMAIKRSQVFGSLFHAKSLAEVYVLGLGSEILPRPGEMARQAKAGASFKQVAGELARPKRIIDAALKQFHEGGLGDHIEGLNRNGLKLEVPDDVSTTIIGDLGKLANSQFETKLGTAVTDKVDFVNKKMDHITWDYMHAGVKTALALDAVAKFKKNNAELHAMNPEKYPLKSMDEIYAEATRYANDATGGLDWLRIATEAKTELGRKVAMNFASPRGRKMAQIILFAPDWAISTLRAGFNSFGKSDTGFRGLLKPTNAVDMYRRYALRSAALWITLLNGIQYAMTGTPIWENDDPTRIQFSDGTSMQPAKHSAEAVHAVMDPVKFAMNKLGFTPSLAADIAAARHGAGFMAISGDSPTWHTVKKAAPFTVSPFVQPHLDPAQRVGRSISGALGMPIYGYTPKQKMLARQERMREAAQKRGER